jgi:hypothetical protein
MYEFNYYFDNGACAACGGNCCRGLGGYVWISLAELERMAAARRMAAALFARQFVRQAADGRLSLQERVINGEHLCCFFDRIVRCCTIYESRPEQCRSFPFWDRFKNDCQELLRECPGCAVMPSQADAP